MTTADSLVAAEQLLVLEHQLREKVVNEEFKIWKKTVPLLYDSIHTHALEWPLLTADFLPKYSFSDDGTKVKVSMLVGSNTSGRALDSIRLVSLDLPSAIAPDCPVEDGPSAAAEPATHPLETLRQWSHPQEVNKIRVNASGSSFLTFDNTGMIHLYDTDKDTPKDFKYHTQEGYCLEWVSNSGFLSGANDGNIALWDISSPLQPTAKYTTHTAAVNDLSYSPAAKVLFGSVSDDMSTQIHDLRSASGSPVIHISENHTQNCIRFHPSVPSLFATGGKDNVVHLYDARNYKVPMRTFFGHNDSVVGLKWDPSGNPNLLYSWVWISGFSRGTYNISLRSSSIRDGNLEPRRRGRITEDPCLLFIHGGHTSRVNDVCLHPTIPSLFASVGDDCLLEVFKPKVVLDTVDDDSDEKEDEEEKSEEEKADEEKADVSEPPNPEDPGDSLKEEKNSADEDVKGEEDVTMTE